MRRRMDCTDCHNRPSHAIASTPERAVNDAMALGHIPAPLPFIHREAVKALKRVYPSEEAGTSRCHDDNHKTKDGKKIGQDCETCHAIE